MIVKKEITTKNYTIIDSGLVSLVNYYDTVVLSYKLGQNEVPINIHIKFKDDQEVEGPGASSNIENDVIIIECINFKGAMGMGLNKPLEISEIDGKKLYFRYWVRDLGMKISREVNYTLYMEN